MGLRARLRLALYALTGEIHTTVRVILPPTG